MNYKQIVINGYTEKRNQTTSYVSYFKREAQIAKRDNFVEFTDFFDGCENAIHDYRGAIIRNYAKQPASLGDFLSQYYSAQFNGQITDDNGKPIQEHIDYLEKEINFLNEKGYRNNNDYYCGTIETGEIVIGLDLKHKLYYSDVTELYKAIIQAKQELIPNNKQSQQITTPERYKNGLDEFLKGNKKGCELDFLEQEFEQIRCTVKHETKGVAPIPDEFKTEQLNLYFDFLKTKMNELHTPQPTAASTSGIIIPDNTNKQSQQLHFTFSFPDTRRQNIFEGLVNGCFIPKDTNINHFNFVFGGKEISNFEPLKWQGKSISLLAYLIDMLFSDTPDNKNMWKITENCFIVNGREKPNINTLKNAVTKYDDKKGYKKYPIGHDIINEIIKL